MSDDRDSRSSYTLLELAEILRALARGIDKFAPDWGLENNQEWCVVQAAKNRGLEIADEILNSLNRAGG